MHTPCSTTLKQWQILSDTGSWENCYWSTTFWNPALDADLGSSLPIAQRLLRGIPKLTFVVDLLDSKRTGTGSSCSLSCPWLQEHQRNDHLCPGLSAFISSSLSPGHPGELLDTTGGPAKIVPTAEGNHSIRLKKAASAKQQKLFYRMINQFYGQMTELVKCQHSVLYCHYFSSQNRDEKSNPE